MIALAGTGVLSPPLALACGLSYGLTLHHPFAAFSRQMSRVLLQASVVALGFGISAGQVAKAGGSGLVYTAAGIVLALSAGAILGRQLRVPGRQSFLISAGTAICGGSAIAAVGPVLNATDEEMTVSLGTVFVLNSVALFVFPAIGRALVLSQTQFGLWSALAIHDTSSVVGAAARYGSTALAVGTTVKLARALWIVPVTVGTAMRRRSQARVQWPWFIALFCAATALNSLLPQLAPTFHILSTAGRLGLSVTLFLIGTGISRRVLREVGVRPMAQGFILWVLVATTSLIGIKMGLIAL